MAIVAPASVESPAPAETFVLPVATGALWYDCLAMPSLHMCMREPKSQAISSMSGIYSHFWLHWYAEDT